MKRFSKRLFGIGDEMILFDNIKCTIKHIPLKRFFDICFSCFILLVSLPLMVVVALLIKLCSRGNVFYSHERMGRGGRRFNCYKFRTMHFDANQRLKKLLQSNPELKYEWERSRKLKKDPRVIPLGYLLRKTSIDELPQFWNVLKGDLSVVGPRPVVQDEMEKHFGQKAGKILSIRPGITGIWQVSGRSDTCYNRRVMLDEKYVDQRSMMLDLTLIAKTIPCIITSKGAY